MQHSYSTSIQTSFLSYQALSAISSSLLHIKHKALFIFPSLRCRHIWFRNTSNIYTTRVFAHPGEDSTSYGRPPWVRRPPAHLDLYDMASMASRSGGSHVESPVAVSPLRPLCRRGNTVPPSPATISSWRR